jgi:hypothetical protein
MSEPICDFCSEVPVVKRYSCISFESLYSCILFESSVPVDDVTLVVDSRGDWAACETCQGLVDQGLWDALHKRSCETYDGWNEANDLVRKILSDYVQELHQQFRAMRLKTN